MLNRKTPGRPHNLQVHDKSPYVGAQQVDEQEDVKASLESLLQQKFEQNPQLVTGELENGLRYVILPNKIPPKRFEAHLEIHAGAAPGPFFFSMSHCFTPCWYQIL